MLKRLEDAIADGDHVRAVIKGSAINNDGSLKVGFTAPSVQGQASVVVEALAAAGVDADTIGYVEAHGTGTALGDPVEIQALTEAFRTGTERRGYCPIGSLKTNIGHLDAAAGVAGLIKTILALEHGEIPPSLHCAQPNPRIDFAASPFFVNTALRPWPAGATPRRAGVSSLGIGGTNAHVIVESAPEAEASGPARDWQVLPLSARTPEALDAAAANLADYLEAHPQACLADVAYTLQVGRKPFELRRAVVCRDGADAVRALRGGEREPLPTATVEAGFRPVTFMFPGQASQHPGMAAGLYAEEPFFREQVDRCAELLRPHVDFDPLAALLGDGRDDAAAKAAINQTRIAQPALFVVEYALAQWLMRAGVKPQAMIGHSLGEYVAACLAGVLSLPDALRLVAARGRLMQALEGGAMLAVRLSPQQARQRLGAGLSLAAVNAPDACVISGAIAAIDLLETALSAEGVLCQRLRTSHAFHSAMMDPVLAPFREVLAGVALKPPGIAYLSNVTGTWAGAEVTTPEYWLRHLRECVEFSAGIAELARDPGRILLEVGPGQALSELARAHRDEGRAPVAIALMRHARDARGDGAHLAGALARLWLAGGRIDWAAMHAGGRRRRLPLPTYPFQRQRYWVDAQPLAPGRPAPARIEKKPDMADWFYLPSWQRSLAPHPPAAERAQESATWLILMDADGVGERLVRRLQALGQQCVRVFPQAQAAHAGADDVCVDPAADADWERLLHDLARSQRKPQRIVHLWNLGGDAPEPAGAGAGADARIVDRGFYALLRLAQAMAKANLIDPVDVWLVCDRLHDLSGNEAIVPEKSLALGPCLVIPQEHANIRCRSIDVEAHAPGGADERAEELVQRLLAEFFASQREPSVAYRGGARWLRTYEPVAMPAPGPQDALPLRADGVYLILGGLGRFGLLLAKHLARTYRARLVLTGREALPPRERWDAIVAAAAEQDPTAWRLRKLLELEALGVEVLTRPLRLDDEAQLSGLVAETVERFGAVHGVVHAAGLQEHVPVLAATRADCERMFAPKVDGLFALERALHGRPLDFCLSPRRCRRYSAAWASPPTPRPICSWTRTFSKRASAGRRGGRSTGKAGTGARPRPRLRTNSAARWRNW
ncbi:SDR family oxidoreductase [Lysobacter enzymogenes]|nr:type I polyketide synthase [Lysobacter enzymogenes]UZW58364.1 SDR family oxidoreductase [Lysobacter enzymogenes]